MLLNCIDRLGLNLYVYAVKDKQKPTTHEAEVSNISKVNSSCSVTTFIPYPTAFPYGNGMVLHFYQQQESSTTKTVHRVINKGLKAYV